MSSHQAPPTGSAPAGAAALRPIRPIRALDAADLAAGDDVSPAALAELMTSLRTGFVYVRQELVGLAEAYDALRHFFALDEPAKTAYTPQHPLDNSGYRGLSSERAAGASAADWKETFQWCSDVPPGHPLRTRFPHRYVPTRFPEPEVPGIAAVLGLLQRQLLDCQRMVLGAIARGLGASSRIAEDLTADADVVTRALHYPPLPAGEPGGTPWADEHVDINLITVLPPASGPGLEIRTEDGWVPAEPPEGHVVLNTGIMLDRLSNGRIPAGRHRVVPPEGGGERYSLAQFCHPTPWTVLAPLAATVTTEWPQRYGPMTAADLLERTLWEIRRPPEGPRA